MISLPCTNCQTVLTIDEAFAGGVCRCQHCGTIQTVPSHLKKGTRSPGSGPAPRALYTSKSRPETASGTGLDHLASRSGSSTLPDPSGTLPDSERGERARDPRTLPPHSNAWAATLIAL